ncbi:MAG: hypothetical protein QW255_04825 [Candidatus Bilamarchaeaceae archaeon]
MKDIDYIIKEVYEREISGFVNVIFRRDVYRLLYRPFIITQLQLKAVEFVCKFTAYSYVFYSNNIELPDRAFYDLCNMHYYGINKFGKKWGKVVGTIETKVHCYLSKYVKDIVYELQTSIKNTYKELHVKSIGNGFVITK